MGQRTLKVASRASRLSRMQTEEALQPVRSLLPPGVTLDVYHLETLGDRDKKTPLSDPGVPDDFFTRDLDDQLRRGACDLTVHSAKDLPKRIPASLAVAAILPCLESRDAVVYRRSRKPDDPVRFVGTSSLRREDAVRTLFPEAVCRPLRGTIDERLAALDRGEFDALIVAACALMRLGLQDRIGDYMPGDPAPLQGHLALVVREGDEELLRLLKPLDFRLHLFDKTPKPVAEARTIPPADGALTLFLGTTPEHFSPLQPMIHWPMIHLDPRPLAERIAMLGEKLGGCRSVVLTSPFAARVFVDAVMHWKDMRALAGLAILAVGPATSDALERLYVASDAAPGDLGGLASLANRLGADFSGRCFYPCSSVAPASDRARALADGGIELVPAVFYDNVENSPGPLPDLPFTQVFFTSPSTVRSYFTAYPHEKESNRRWLAIGPSTRTALESAGLKAVIPDFLPQDD